MTGNPSYRRSVEKYINAFLSSSIDSHGMFQWGNHMYFDLFAKTIIKFQNGYHELRPITPAWELFWQMDARSTERYIREMVRRHLYDPASGGFNRHDTQKKDHAFLEAGGILCESLAWLFQKTADSDLLHTALRIARYSYGHRNLSTGLVANQPDKDRWDAHVCTSEVGLWAQCLLRAHEYSGHEEFADMARAALTAYLTYAFEEKSGELFGQVALEDGRPAVPEGTCYRPRYYADPWNTDQWPTHDYPMSVAEASLSLYRLTAEKTFLDWARQLARIAYRKRPAVTGQPAYAECYGRCIHLLDRLARESGDQTARLEADTIAGEAISDLYRHSMFSGYSNHNYTESVDGVGFLFLALLQLDSAEPLNLLGFGF
jgi:hypothetical protein